jgi:hypothetical protein
MLLETLTAAIGDWIRRQAAKVAVKTCRRKHEIGWRQCVRRVSKWQDGVRRLGRRGVPLARSMLFELILDLPKRHHDPGIASLSVGSCRVVIELASWSPSAAC